MATFSGNRTDDVFGLVLGRDGTWMLRAGIESTVLVQDIFQTPQDACEQVEAK
ncbi:hypothetical protein [Pseudofrankia sp. BMG5.37]|uniref:hypothetical protein n=1 Tax=Pseudofrankia sp. BMG5.37 TaxID=3050035 RepID=UPI00289EE897|nr:hypothetical protein [Pseudofrankia sp. BMG5.37]